jgi:hypothetical protein
MGVRTMVREKMVREKGTSDATVSLINKSARAVKSFVTLFSMYVRESLTRLPVLWMLVFFLFGIGALLVGFFREPEVSDMVDHISGMQLPEQAIYGAAIVIARVVGPLAGVQLLALIYVVFQGASHGIREQERTIMTQPVSPRAIGAARVLVTTMPIILVRTALILIGFGLYSWRLSVSSADFVYLLLPTVWAPVLVCMIHDLFLYSAMFFLSRMLAHPVLGLAAAYLISFPSFVNDALATNWANYVPGGLLSSERVVLFLFYSVLMPSQFSHIAWQSEIGSEFVRSGLVQVLSIWIVGSFLFAWLAVEITRRLSQS